MSGRFPHADLIRALNRLDAVSDEGISRQVAGLLGLDWIATEIRTPSPITPPPPSPPDLPPIRPPARDEVDPATSLPRDFIPITVQAVDTGEPRKPDWLDTVDSLPLPLPEPVARLPIEPLLRERWLRAILVAALSTPTESGDVDSAKLIDSIAQKKALTELPLLRVPGMAKGVHCWIDAGEGMQPFESDQEQLLAGLLSIFGSSRVWIRQFTGLPDLGQDQPLGGAPLLLLTALGQLPVPGALGEALTHEWVKFAVEARTQGASHTVALVPFPSWKCPSKIRREMVVVSWDRPSSVQSVRRSRTLVRA